MIRLFIVGDGPRDEAMIPRLIERILPCTVSSTFEPWKAIRLNRGGAKGYRRKFAFAIRQATDLRVDGIVATLDSDNDPQRARLSELVGGRDDFRSSHPPFPAAIGEAVPHAEAWLLDDPVAVRKVLDLSQQVLIPTVRQTDNPKSTLGKLYDQSEMEFESILDCLSQLSQQLELQRCQHDAETGFRAFVKDVRHELAVLAQKQA